MNTTFHFTESITCKSRVMYRIWVYTEEQRKVDLISLPLCCRMSVYLSTLVGQAEGPRVEGGGADKKNLCSNIHWNINIDRMPAHVYISITAECGYVELVEADAQLAVASWRLCRHQEDYQLIWIWKVNWKRCQVGSGYIERNIVCKAGNTWVRSTKLTLFDAGPIGHDFP